MITITEHAKIRAKERLGIEDEQILVTLTNFAMRNGDSSGRYKSKSCSDFIKSKEKKNPYSNIYILSDMVFVVLKDEPKLVTVYKLEQTICSPEKLVSIGAISEYCNVSKYIVKKIINQYNIGYDAIMKYKGKDTKLYYNNRIDLIKSFLVVRNAINKIYLKEKFAVEDFIRLHTCGFDVDFMKRCVHERNIKSTMKQKITKEDKQCTH